MLVLTSDEALREQAPLQILYRIDLARGLTKRPHILLKICEILACGLIDYF
jgi:hypothetical protein